MKDREKRETSFIDKEVERWLKNALELGEEGLCLKRFKADIATDGVLKWQEGTVVEVNKQTYEITQVGKRCFSQCTLLKKTGKRCILAEGVAFGKKV